MLSGCSKVKASSRTVRRIIRDQDLPDYVDPQSPFRHHPKYQVSCCFILNVVHCRLFDSGSYSYSNLFQRRTIDDDQDMVQKMEALTAFCAIEDVWPHQNSTSSSTTSSSSDEMDTSSNPDIIAVSVGSPKQMFNEVLDSVLHRELILAE